MRKPITMLLAAAGGLVVSAGLAVPAVAAPPGYQIVSSPGLPAPPGPFDTGSQIACPAGTVTWGGGAATNAFSDQSVNTTEPLVSGWETRVNNPTTAGGLVFVDAICAKKPRLYTVAFATVDNPAGARTTATATCPANTVVLSGGSLSTSDEVGARLLGLWPAGRTAFTGVMLNATSTNQRFTVEAICAKQPAGYKIARRTVTEDVDTLDIGGESCPSGLTVLGGGVRVSGADTTVLVHSSINNLQTGWSNILLTGNSQVGLTFSAICAA